MVKSKKEEKISRPVVSEHEEKTKKKTSKWKNRERALVFCSRGVSYRDRHLMQDFQTLLAHSKSESKMDKNQPLGSINEIADMRNASKVLYFECKKKKDLYLWVAATPKGPSAKFLVHNVHTMAELRLTGNCLVGSRPLLSFHPDFARLPHLALLKELFTQTLGTPAFHPKSQPFVDHVFNFGLSPDGRIWFRNYQILDDSFDAPEPKLEEIGPRMVLEPIRIFQGSFGGPFLYENPAFRSPNILRRAAKTTDAGRYVQRVQARKADEQRRAEQGPAVPVDPLDDLFDTRPLQLPQTDQAKKAKRLLNQLHKPRRKRAKKSARLEEPKQEDDNLSQ